MIDVQEVLTPIRNGQRASRFQKLKISGRVRPIAERMVFSILNLYSLNGRRLVALERLHFQCAHDGSRGDVGGGWGSCGVLPWVFSRSRILLLFLVRRQKIKYLRK